MQHILSSEVYLTFVTTSTLATAAQNNVYTHTDIHFMFFLVYLITWYNRKHAEGKTCTTFDDIKIFLKGLGGKEISIKMISFQVQVIFT